MSTPQSLTTEIKKHSAWSIFMGVLTAALGIFLIAYPMATATITTVILGWVLIFVGIAEFVFALHSRSVGSFFLKVFLSIVYAIAGIILAFFPIAGVAALTVLLGAMLLVHAGIATVIAFQVKPGYGWGWFLCDGLASLCLSLMILLHWPASSLWAIGTLVGVSVLISGTSRIIMAAEIGTGASAVERLAH